MPAAWTRASAVPRPPRGGFGILAAKPAKISSFRASSIGIYPVRGFHPIKCPCYGTRRSLYLDGFPLCPGNFQFVGYFGHALDMAQSLLGHLFLEVGADHAAKVTRPCWVSNLRLRCVRYGFCSRAVKDSIVQRHHVDHDRFQQFDYANGR